MRVGGDWLTRAATQGVLAALSAAGFRALVVGGAVRNALRGVAVADVDIATDALPAQVVRIAGAAGLRAVPTGIDHGTVTVVADGVPHEVTTFRRDVETDGRHAVVAFTDDIAADAARRDFTMNALYCTAEGEVIDPLGGVDDAVAGRVRFVGHASLRIAEDALRILRFFRFHSVYGDAAGGLDAEGLAACAAAAGDIPGLSRERIGAEMRKLLAAADPAPAVAAMAAAGVLAQVLPGADATALAVLVHVEDGAPVRWLRRLASLGGEDPGSALRLSRAEAGDLARVSEAAREGAAPSELGYRLGADLAADAVLVRAALMGSALPERWGEDVAKGAAAVFPLRAADLMPNLQGPALGEALRRAEARWIASGFALTAEDLRKGG